MPEHKRMHGGGKSVLNRICLNKGEEAHGRKKRVPMVTSGKRGSSRLDFSHHVKNTLEWELLDNSHESQ